MQVTTMYLKRAALGAAAAALIAVPASSAEAAPTGIYSDFAQCPVNTPAPPDSLNCLVSDTTSGAIKLGNQNVPINKRIRLQGAFINTAPPNETLFPALNGQTLEKTPLDVPGGLSGIVTPTGFGGPLLQAFQNAVATANGVKATAELVGSAKFNFDNYQTSTGIAVTLPVRVKLDNPFLGPNCYIGSSSSPITLRLTTGQTSPPSGVAPLTGTPGAIGFQDGGYLVTANGYSLVDNTFTAPAASGCGYLPVDQLLITAAVNAKVGLPAGAGKNSAVLKGNAKVGDASRVKASDPNQR